MINLVKELKYLIVQKEDYLMINLSNDQLEKESSYFQHSTFLIVTLIFFKYHFLK